jgi:hypothetical protein
VFDRNKVGKDEVVCIVLVPKELNEESMVVRRATLDELIQVEDCRVVHVCVREPLVSEEQVR